jgi:hypothetical protein
LTSDEYATNEPRNHSLACSACASTLAIMPPVRDSATAIVRPRAMASSAT